ncbi:MAG TPA: amidohydrolase family protein, partial [Opitutaceae bacterium]
MKPRQTITTTLGLLLAFSPVSLAATTADLILFNGKVWTVDERQPIAQAVAVAGSRILQVGTDDDVMALRGPVTRLIDLKGQLVLPGFNDAHTHFENAVDWVFHVRLVDVHHQEDMLTRLRTAAARVPSGLWITGGDLEAFAGLAAQRRSDDTWKGFWPELAAVDEVVPNHPVLLRRFDRTYFANSKALRTLGITHNTPDPPGGTYGRD